VRLSLLSCVGGSSSAQIQQLVLSAEQLAHGIEILQRSMSYRRVFDRFATVKRTVLVPA
jgi:hypothetical protein